MEKYYGLLVPNYGNLESGGLMGPFRSLEQVEESVINQRFDEENECFVWGVCEEFFRMTHEVGLYLYVVEKEDSYTDFFAEGGAAYSFVGEVDIRQLGVLHSMGEELVDGLGVSCYESLDLAQSFITHCFQEGKPLQVWLGAYGFTGQVGSLVQVNEDENGNLRDVRLVLGSAGKGKPAMVGLVMGHLAKLETDLAESLALESRESLPLESVWWVGDVPVHAFSEDEVDEVATKGFVFAKRRVGKAGFYLATEAVGNESLVFSQLSERRLRDEVWRASVQHYEKELKEKAVFDGETGEMEENARLFIQASLRARLVQEFVLTGKLTRVEVRISSTHNYLEDARLPLEFVLGFKQKVGRPKWDVRAVALPPPSVF